MLGRARADLVHPDDVRGRHRDDRRSSRVPGETFTVEYRIRHKDGCWRVHRDVARTLVARLGRRAASWPTAATSPSAWRPSARCASATSSSAALIENASDLVLMIDAPTGASRTSARRSSGCSAYARRDARRQDRRDLLHPDDVGARVGDLRAPSTPGRGPDVGASACATATAAGACSRASRARSPALRRRGRRRATRATSPSASRPSALLRERDSTSAA